ncbi:MULTISPECIES: GNAT family N-acetyltransferase [Enterobacter]|jgi:ribosomal protein S18 acetylase RimI-like enzyme|uniref:GNAT family N-acetyltransferase n=1 Tax=Enterobacter bugandensis TaxID=881260 RepID=A0ABX4VGX2_9ENTR|nr:MULTISPECIES: GNAT family N-acetyltransferase [Enterobacter]EHF4969968.1 GNAT family N-acetyltransferase [Enterobacter hormaechei]EKY4004112.1 GNAT family N-acetyltransferase [Enterobacter roggenkampii]ELF4135041.1 GNAT family N-acetyltransferase [Enterobacter hormaechei]ESN47044.1 hypothetical protein L362_04580 [Enterobacter sp. MGH 16]KAA0593312.1 GNAT family N-acetyltransferase [Enterobacter hormaechei]
MMDLTITKATVADAREAVRLIALADEDAVMAISGQATLADALARYEQDFTRTDVYFGYENVIVARKGTLVVGCILSFKGTDEDRYAALDSQGGEFPRESDDDEIYIDSLAVDPDHRGGGIAKQLVRAVIEQAAAQGFTKVSLLADVAKPHLGKLYRSLGFVEVKRMRYLNDEYEKLVFDMVQANTSQGYAI